MNPDLEQIIELEKTDREIARLRQEVAALPARVAAIEAKLNASKAQVEAARGKIKAGETAKRKYEQEIQAEQQKISKYRDQSLDVKTNDQYKALLHEITFAEQAIRGCEDKILEVMVDADAQEKAARVAEAELKEETAEIEKEKKEAHAITAKDEAELKAWNAKRDALRAGIEESALRQYERVTKLRGTGTAEARDHKCMACQVMLRPQVYIEVLSNEKIVPCSSCGRILYASKEAIAQVEANHEEQHSVEKAWFYVPKYGTYGAFVAFVNHKGSCSRRVFDADTGLVLHQPKIVRNSVFKEAFREDFEAGTPVTVTHQPNLERDCVEQLPGHILFELQNQVTLAPVNAGSSQDAVNQ